MVKVTSTDCKNPRGVRILRHEIGAGFGLCLLVERVCKKWKDTSEAKLEPLAAIRLIGRRGQQGWIDGSITWSIWWPNRTVLAGRPRSPSLGLSYSGAAFTLTQENLSLHLCWFTPGLCCPVNLFWPAHVNNFNARRFMLPSDFALVKYDAESWQLRSVSPTTPPK